MLVFCGVRRAPAAPPRQPLLEAGGGAFFGRQHEIEIIEEALRRGAPLVTLVGPPGIGTTELALRVARITSAHGGAPARLADVSHRTLEAGVRREVALALGLARDEPETDDPRAIALAMAARRHLLVLDGIRDWGPVVGPLESWIRPESTAPILATATEPSGLRGEFVVEVGPLTEAEALFVERARRARPDFDEEQERLAVTMIVDLLERVPQSIALVASAVRHKSVGDVLNELAEHVSRGRDAVLRFAFEQLNDAERQAVLAASIFEGPFPLELAAEIAGGPTPLLAASAKGWLTPIPRTSRRSLMLMARVPRAFARDALVAEGREDEVFGALARAIEKDALAVAQGDSGLSPEDLRAAIRRECQRRVPAAVAAAAAIDEMGMRLKPQDWEALDTALAGPLDDVLPAVLARALLARATSHVGMGQRAEALAAAVNAAKQAQIAGDWPLAATASAQAATLGIGLPEHEPVVLVHSSLTRVSRGSPTHAMLTLIDGQLLLREGRLTEAEARLTPLVANPGRTPLLLAQQAYLALAVMALERGDEQGCNSFIAAGHGPAGYALDELVAVAEWLLGVSALFAGDEPAAEQALRKALLAAEASGRLSMYALVSATLAVALSALGHAEEAQQAFANAHPVRTAETSPQMVSLLGALTAFLQAKRGDATDAEAVLGLRRMLASPDYAPVNTSDRVVRQLVERFIARALAPDSEDSPASSSQLPVIFVGPEAQWFQVGEGTSIISLARRKSLRLLLDALCKQHDAAPAENILWTDLVSVGWGGERMTPEAAKNRLHVAIATLRGMGLRSLLLSTHGHGYRLDPRLVLTRVTS